MSANIKLVHKTSSLLAPLSQEIIVNFEHVNWHSNNQWQRLMV